MKSGFESNTLTEDNGDSRREDRRVIITKACSNLDLYPSVKSDNRIRCPVHNVDTAYRRRDRLNNSPGRVAVSSICRSGGQ